MKKTILLLSFITSFNAIYGQTQKTWCDTFYYQPFRYEHPDSIRLPKGIITDNAYPIPNVYLDTAALLKDGWQLPRINKVVLKKIN